LLHKHCKEGASVVTHFWVPTKIMRKYKKKYKKYSEEIQKIIGARKGCWNAEKMLKLVEEMQKIQKVEI
jgi:Skp family chaperone for outer membrane proteins